MNKRAWCTEDQHGGQDDLTIPDEVGDVLDGLQVVRLLRVGEGRLLQSLGIVTCNRQLTKLQRSLEDAEDDEELTNELVVVVLQLFRSVPAVAIVGLSHLLAVDFLELKKARLLLTSAQGILTRICALSQAVCFQLDFLQLKELFRSVNSVVFLSNLITYLQI